MKIEIRWITAIHILLFPVELLLLLLLLLFELVISY